ncbi:MAG TPA: hypothetical protein DDW65_07855, partial [Firmicutes bacterium]|nr:hypothetical protein [Bacillota bacterium]
KSLVIEIDEILQLLVKHNVMAINYDEIINTFCRCTGAEADVIATQLKYMEKLGHLQIEEDRNNQTVIRLPYRKI